MKATLAVLTTAIFIGSFLGESGLAETKKAEARLGGLVVIAQSVEISSPSNGKPQNPGFHDVRFRVAFRNVSKQAICTGLRVTLESTVGVESRGSVHFDDKDHQLGVQAPDYPIIHMLLPASELEADVLFNGEKDGVEPRTLVVTQSGGWSQDCNSKGNRHLVDPARIPVKNIPILQTTLSNP